MSRNWGWSRGQATVLGVALLFGIMITGTTLVLVMGSGAISTTQGHLDTQRAETAMTNFDSQTARVALGDARVQQVDLPTDGSSQYHVRPDWGWMNVSYTNTSTGDVTTIFNESMGAVVYEAGQTTVAYQGGGVWQARDNGSAMVSPPEFHYRNATLTLPLVTVSGDSSVGERVSIGANGTVNHYPNASADLRNPLRNGRVEVTVHSRYYLAWGRFFEQRTDGRVAYDHARDRVTIELVVPPDRRTVQGGLVTAPSGTLEIHNHATVDSYNSSTGPYPGYPARSDTWVISDSDVTVNNHATLHGNLEASGEVSVDNHGTITGNVRYETLDNRGNIGGWTENNASVRSPSSVEPTITERVNTLGDASNNDNAAEDTIDAGTNTLDCGAAGADCTITAGSYYLDSMAPDDHLTLDTSGGDIQIAVDGPVDVEHTISVVGTGRVNIYATGDVDFRAHPAVEVTGDDATRFWLYMVPDSTAEFYNLGSDTPANVTGVIYGPGPGGSPGATIELGNHAHIFGALVGDVTFVSNYYGIHYDEALRNVDTVTRTTDVPAITYLHVSTNDINVTG
ncbi:MAG: hypothetical protein ABEJ89_06370 [Haloarculaceae archaeon]